jgi:hypothetical protein
VISLDVFRDRDELRVIVSGADAAPVVVDEGTGHSATLRPARLTGIGNGIINAFGNPTPGLFWGEMPIGQPVDEARLHVVTNGRDYRTTVRWPAQEPAPLPVPPVRRQRRKV